MPVPGTRLTAIEATKTAAAPAGNRSAWIAQQDGDGEDVGQPEAGDAVFELQQQDRNGRQRDIAGSQKCQDEAALQLGFVFSLIKQRPAPPHMLSFRLPAWTAVI